MYRSLKYVCSTLALAVAICGAAAQAEATPLVLIVSNPTQSVTQGGTIIFSGSVTNPNATPITITNLFLEEVEGDIFQILSVFAPPGLILPLTVPGMTTQSLDLFGINYRTNAVAGVYTYDLLLTTPLENSNRFRVTVTVLQPVPEPATMLLLGTGVAGAAGAIRKRRKAQV